jgi:hypothetical protein
MSEGSRSRKEAGPVDFSVGEWRETHEKSGRKEDAREFVNWAF